MKKSTTVEVFYEYRKDWETPDVFVYTGKGKFKDKLMLREHHCGRLPFAELITVNNQTKKKGEI